jgi:hypothetical protein
VVSPDNDDEDEDDDEEGDIPEEQPLLPLPYLTMLSIIVFGVVVVVHY